ALTIGLDALSSEQTSALIGEIIDRSLISVDAEAVLLERAGGNPLYAQEYVRALVERGANAMLPESVQGIIAARLDGLSLAEKGLLQDAAVIGETVWLGSVCALGERDRAEADALTLRLERKQLVHRSRRSSVAGEVEFSFTHTLIREVAYSQLPRAARAERHQRAAAWLERVATDRADTAELIAQHYTTSLELETALGRDTEALRPAALAALTAAARQAAAKHDHTAVMRYAETAATLRPDAALGATLLVLRALAGYTAGHPDELVLLEARDAAVANGRAEDAVHLTCALSEWAEYYAPDAERSVAYETEALRLAADLPPGPIASLPAYSAAYRLYQAGRHDEAIDLTNVEIARARRAGADAAVGLMLIWRGSARFEAGEDDGIFDLREAARILDEQAHPKAAIAAYNLGDMLHGLGQFDGAVAAFETAAANAHRSGNGFSESMAQMGLALVAYHRGDPTSVRALLERPSTDTSEYRATNVAETQGRLLLEVDPHDARAAARQRVAFARRTAHVDIECSALALAARAAQALGDNDAANIYLDEYVEAWTRVGGISSCSASLVEAGLVLVAHNRHGELAAAVDLLRIATPWTDAARALAERRYAEAAAILDTIPSVPLRDAALHLAGDS
ncbi:MAG: hypothetical protein QOG65_3412, partial [Actinomycetota bacterium]|nr:hypothetical protein [Actinomycetota bacterium]